MESNYLVTARCRLRLLPPASYTGCKMESRKISQPELGWYKFKRQHDGRWLAARIDRDCYCTVNAPSPHDWLDSCDRHPRLRGVLGSQEIDPNEIWLSGERISEAEYLYLVQSLAYDRATGRERINLSTIDPRRFLP